MDDKYYWHKVLGWTFLITAFLWVFCQPYSSTNNIPVEQPKQQYEVISFEPYKLVDTYQGISGTIKNVSDKKINSITISYNLYDKEGYHYHTAYDMASNLLPGTVWKYYIPIYGTNCYHIELVEIKTY